ncbi:hypothetical protein BH09VER1_BH09VER1_51410 [soil metagenome]
MMMRLLFYLCAMALVSAVAMAGTATPEAPVELVGTKGKFDSIEIDAAARRLLACHTENNTLDVVGLGDGKLTKSIPTGAAQGVAIDAKNGRYYVSVSQPPKVVIIDSAKLEVIGEVALPGAADLLAYHEGTNRLFVCGAEKPEMWVVDPEGKTVVKTIALSGGGLEDLGFDVAGNFLFVNLEETNEIARIDAAKLEVIDVWPTAPSEQPHGLVVIPVKGDLLIAGANGKLTNRHALSGRLVEIADIAPKSDQIAYDPALSMVYCASGTGVISVVNVKDDIFIPQPPIPSEQGAHSIAVDPQTHALWIAYAKGEQSFVQKIGIAVPPAGPTPKAGATASPVAK